MYGAFVDHLPSMLLLAAIVVVCFAYATTGRASPDNRRTHTSANGEARRAVGYGGRVEPPVGAGESRRPEPRNAR